MNDMSEWISVNADIYTENLRFNYTTSYDISDNYYLHCHNFYEIYYFLEGDADYLVEGRKYTPKPHSLLLFSPHVFHGIRVNSAAAYRRYAIHFNPEILTPERRSFLLSAFPTPDKLPSTKEVYYENTGAGRMNTLFEGLVEASHHSREFQENFLPVCIEGLLAQTVLLSDSLNPPKAAGSSEAVLSSDPLTDIILYLNRHLAEDICLEDLSERFYISKHHLNKVFRKATGTTVIDYLLHKRVILAQQLLIGGASAAEAASRSGFGDYSSFYRTYLRILGHSPLKDRGVLSSFQSAAPNRNEDINFGTG